MFLHCLRIFSIKRRKYNGSLKGRCNVFSKKLGNRLVLLPQFPYTFILYPCLSGKFTLYFAFLFHILLLKRIDLISFWFCQRQPYRLCLSDELSGRAKAKKIVFIANFKSFNDNTLKTFTKLTSNN